MRFSLRSPGSALALRAAAPAPVDRAALRRRVFLDRNAMGGLMGGFGTTCRRLPRYLLTEVTEVTETEGLSESCPRASYPTVRVPEVSG